MYQLLTSLKTFLQRDGQAVSISMWELQKNAVAFAVCPQRLCCTLTPTRSSTNPSLAAPNSAGPR